MAGYDSDMCCFYLSQHFYTSLYKLSDSVRKPSGRRYSRKIPSIYFPRPLKLHVAAGKHAYRRYALTPEVRRLCGGILHAKLTAVNFSARKNARVRYFLVIVGICV